MNILYKHFLKSVVCNEPNISDTEQIKKDYFSQLGAKFCEDRAMNDELSLTGRIFTSSERQNIVLKLSQPLCGYIGIGQLLKELKIKIKAFDKFYSTSRTNQLFLLNYILSHQKDNVNLDDTKKMIELGFDIEDIPLKFFRVTAEMLEANIREWKKDLI